jgi:hypothetical protein
MTDRERRTDGLTAAESAELTRGILARTSGAACERAHGLLGELVYGNPAGMDAELLRSHLEHCDGCAELARAMVWAKALLPAMACLEPDAGFTADVLAATTRARRAATTATWPARCEEYARRLWMRPRFALEFAYVATMALLFLFGAPFSTGTRAPGHALDVATSTLAPNLADLHRAVGRGARVWDLGREGVDAALRNVGADLDGRGRRTAAAAGDLHADAGIVIDAAGAFEFDRAADHLGAVGEDLAWVWRGLFGAPPAAGATGGTND